MTKKELRLQLILITLMGESELDEFQVKLSMSNVDDKARKFMQKAIDKKRDYFRGKSSDAMAVCSNIDMEEV
jgi:hypothetical protein